MLALLLRPALAPLAPLALSACSAESSELIHQGPTTNGGYPETPPARVCGESELLAGADSAPAAAIVVPAGDNSNFDFGRANVVYWFAPGVHTLGSERSAQISPAEGASFIGGRGAVLDGKGINAYAFTQKAANVRIAYLEIRNFVAPNDEAVVNHDAGAGWQMEHDYIHDNGGAAVFVSSGNVLRASCLANNGQYGLQGIGPGGGGSGSNLSIENNEITQNGAASDSGAGAKFWDVDGVRVTNNWVHDNSGAGLWADTNVRNFVCEGNFIESNADEAIFYDLSYNARIQGNTLKRNALTKGQAFAARNDNFPVAAIYISESGGDERVPGTPNLEISGNWLEDNWGGVALWEDANRFCNSPANQSADYCTLVNPAATLTSCAAPAIASPPLYDDCRWKTQNVSVRDNVFSVTPGAIGCAEGLCARMALLSNRGTTPSWSPYLGTLIEDAITFSQNNHFSNNAYSGPWRFVAHDSAQSLDFATWQAAPYAQDIGSSLK